MKKDEFLGVIAIYVLLYLLTRLVTFISVMNGFFEGDIILMVVILFLVCCFSIKSGEGINVSLVQREIAKRDKRLTHRENLDLVRRQYLLNKSIQDIANDLGMSMISVKKYIDEIEDGLKK